MRVGAGIGAKHLARKDVGAVGILGSGGMARTYLEAFVAVRPIKHAKMFSPTLANRNRFAAEMSAKLGIAIEAVDTAREAVRGVDILPVLPHLQMLPWWRHRGRRSQAAAPDILTTSARSAAGPILAGS